MTAKGAIATQLAATLLGILLLAFTASGASRTGVGKDPQGQPDGQVTLYEDEGDSYNYEKRKYATIPILWNEAKHTLEIGKSSGEFPGMLKNRTFNIAWVSENHGAGIPITLLAGNALQRGRKLSSRSSGTCRFPRYPVPSFTSGLIAP